jgi:hypothetical protein
LRDVAERRGVSVWTSLDVERVWLDVAKVPWSGGRPSNGNEVPVRVRRHGRSCLPHVTRKP